MLSPATKSSLPGRGCTVDPLTSLPTPQAHAFPRGLCLWLSSAEGGEEQGILENESPKESRKHTVTTAMKASRFAVVISEENNQRSRKKNLIGKCLKERHSCAANTV